MWGLDRWYPVARGTGTWRGLAAVPGLLAILLVASALRRFRAAGTTVNPLDPDAASHLVTGGVYRWTRNPMYLGLLLLLAAWALWMRSAAPWVVLPLFVGFLTVAQIRPEEAALQRRFGEAYDAYRARVRRWL
ncbi:MAG: isoprenylcysteine carboxylmethyltransferase family protein [Proteobacteria bacterium]|nr:isoprenylcysteine carboxylmethyltransferase family protein [Pseudomonadota bacterium]